MNLFPPPQVFGVRIIEDAYALTETTERLFPESRHRSARVRKKLIKRFGGEFRKRPTIFQVNGTLLVHPSIAAQLRQRLAADRDRILDVTIMGGR